MMIISTFALLKGFSPKKFFGGFSAVIILIILIILPVQARGLAPRPVLQSILDVSYVTGSLTPRIVLAGESVAYQIRISNPNNFDIILDHNSTISFTTNDGNHYVASIFNPPVILAGQQSALTFLPIVFAEYASSEVVTPVINLLGVDASGQLFHQEITLEDFLTIHPNQSGLVEIIGSLQPFEPSRQSMVVFWVRMKNTTDCAIQINSPSQIILSTDTQWIQQTGLLQPLTIQPGEEKRMDFGSYDQFGDLNSHIVDELPDGVYHPRFRLFGIRVCDGASFSMYIDSQNTIAVNPAVGATGGFGSSGMGYFEMTQMGSAIEVNGGSGSSTDPYQVLVGVTLESRCDDVGCHPLPPGTYSLDNPYFYLKGTGYFFTRLFINPTPDMVNIPEWRLVMRIIRQTRSIGPGVVIRTGVRWDPRIIIIERKSEFEYQGINVENTFIRSGDTNAVSIHVVNPFTGTPKGNITIMPESHLILTKDGEDITANFSQDLKSAGMGVPQENNLAVLFDLTPGPGTPLGKVSIDASTTGSGNYPYYQRTAGDNPIYADPYNGPITVDIEGTTISSSQIDPGFFYIVDRIPFELISNLGQSEAIGDKNLQLELAISNHSDWQFSIAPESYVDLPIVPEDSLMIDTTPVGSGLYIPGADFAQGIRPVVTFNLDRVDFIWAPPYEESGFTPIDYSYNIELVSANQDGTISNNVLTRQDFHLPAGSPANSGIPITMQPMNVRLQAGELYFLIAHLPPQSRIAQTLFEDHYPDGNGFTFFNGRWEGTSDITFKLHANEIIHRAASGLVEPVVLAPGQQIRLPFQFVNPISNAVDGAYFPKLFLLGEGTNTEETIPFRQHITNSNTVVVVDNVVPSATIASLPARSTPPMNVAWEGNDNSAGIQDFDVQVSVDNGEWIDWLRETLDNQRVYPAESGHSYTFRVRARDRALNVGAWSVPVTTLLSNPPVTTISFNPSPVSPNTYQGVVSITFDASAASGSTIASTNFELDGGLQQIYASPIFVSGSGVHNIRYWSMDNFGLSEIPNTNTFTILNTPPAIDEGDSVKIEMTEDNTPDEFSLTLHANDVDTTDVLTWSISTAATHGAAEASALGVSSTIGYLPASNYNGVDRFIVQVTDGNGGSDYITVDVTIAAINDPPVANSQTISANAGINTEITLAADDVDGGGLTWTLLSEPAYGTLTGYAPDLIYRARFDYSGSDSFIFRVNDGEMNSNSATVDIAVSIDNHPPVASSSALATNEDNSVTINMIASDPDMDAGDYVAAYQLITPPAHGILATLGANSGTYTPEENYFGSDGIIFRARDARGAWSSPATITITVDPINDPPVIRGQSVLQTGEDTELALSFSDLTVSDVDDEYPDGFTLIALPGQNYTVEGITITPDLNFNGEIIVPVIVSDGTVDSNTFHLGIHVTQINDAPIANTQTVTVNEDVPKEIILTGYDVESTVLSYMVVDAPTHGTLSGTAPSLVYLPELNYRGVDSFTFRVYDGELYSSVETVTIAISPETNFPPIITEGDQQYVTMSEDGSPSDFHLLLHATDANIGDTLAWSISRLPSHGVAGVSDTGSATVVSYIPTRNYAGTDRFVILVSDGNSSSDSITVNVTIDAVNDTPFITDQDPSNVTMSEDGVPVTFALVLHAYDADPNDTLSWSISTDASHGTSTATPTGASSNITYIPVANYHGEDSFVVQVSDGNGGFDFVTVDVTINSVNDIPVITGQSVLITVEDTTLPITMDDLIVTDVDHSYPDGFALEVGLGENYSVVGTDVTPALNFNGTLSVPITVNDGIDRSTVYHVAVIVTAVNDDPVILEGSAVNVRMSEDGLPIAFDLTLHASDGDSSDTLHWNVASEAVHGIVHVPVGDALSKISYTPTENFGGEDHFVVQVSDGNDASDRITVDVIIEPVNDAPVILEGSTVYVMMSKNGSPTAFNLMLHASDVDTSDTLTWSIVTAASHGTASAMGIGATKVITYTPSINFTGTDRFVVRASDGSGDAYMTTVYVTVVDVPRLFIPIIRTEP